MPTTYLLCSFDTPSPFSPWTSGVGQTTAGREINGGFGATLTKALPGNALNVACGHARNFRGLSDNLVQITDIANAPPRIDVTISALGDGRFRIVQSTALFVINEVIPFVFDQNEWYFVEILAEGQDTRQNVDASHFQITSKINTNVYVNGNLVYSNGSTSNQTNAGQISPSPQTTFYTSCSLFTSNPGNILDDCYINDGTILGDGFVLADNSAFVPVTPINENATQVLAEMAETELPTPEIKVTQAPAEFMLLPTQQIWMTQVLLEIVQGPGGPLPPPPPPACILNPGPSFSPTYMNYSEPNELAGT